MSDRDERVELLLTAWRAFEAGEVRAVLEYLDPEVEVFAPPEAGNPGTFHGHEGFLNWVGHWYEAWEDFSQEVVDVEPFGQRCVVADVRQVARGRSAGLELERTVSYVYELRDGKVVYMALFVDEVAARAAAAEREGA
jgi:ketosteroid isomerase-like protein